MSIFDYQNKNNITIRSRAILCESIRKYNRITGEYEEIISGGGGDTPELPYYLEPDKIQFRNTEMALDGVYLNAVNESIDDLDAICTQNMSRITAVEGENVIQGSKISAIEGVNTTQNTKISNLESKTAYMNKAATYLNMAYGNSGYKTHMDQNGLSIYSGSSIISPSAPYCRIGTNSIELFTTTGSVYLDVSRFDNIAKLISVTNSNFNTSLDLIKPIYLTGTINATENTNKKMLVIDNSTQLVSRMDIPSGVTLPSYLYPNYINITNGTNSISINSNVIEYSREVNGNFEVMQLDWALISRLVSVGKNPENKWTAPDYNTMGGTSPTVIVNNTVSGFNKAIHFFREMEVPGDVLWVNLSTWNASVGTDEATSRGIFLSMKCYEYSENHIWTISYSGTNVSISHREVFVSNTTSESRRCLFISFKSNSGTTSVNGWVKIKLENSFKSPIYPGVGTAYPSSAIQP